MSLRAAMKVPKYSLFYFPSDHTASVVPLKNIFKVISGDDVSMRSKVEIKYDKLEVEAEILGVNGKFMV